MKPLSRSIPDLACCWHELPISYISKASYAFARLRNGEKNKPHSLRLDWLINYTSDDKLIVNRCCVLLIKFSYMCSLVWWLANDAGRHIASNNKVWYFISIAGIDVKSTNQMLRCVKKMSEKTAAPWWIRSIFHPGQWVELSALFIRC